MKALLVAPMGSVHRLYNTANINALKDLGYEIHLAANFDNADGAENKNQEYVKKCRANGIIIHSIPFKRHSLLGNLTQLKSIKDLVNKNFDIIHAHTETGGLLLRLAGLFNKKGRFIYTAHGMSFYKGSSLKSQLIYRPIEWWICSGMDANIAINKEEYKVLKLWNNKSAKYVHGVGLDLERVKNNTKDRATTRAEIGIPEDAKVILSIGELDDNKNHQVVIKALASIKEKNVHYVICGVGDNKDLLMKLAAENGLSEQVHLLGFRNDIPDIIHACDIFAFPSFHEGLPVSLSEAMAGGLPVVCSEIRGNVDLVRNGKNGFLADPADNNSWVRVLTVMLHDRKMLDTFTKVSGKVINKYSIDSVYDEIKNVYMG